MSVREAVRAYIELDQDEHTDEIIKVLQKAYGTGEYVDAILAEVNSQESKLDKTN